MFSRHLQEWSFRHSSTVEGKESDSNAVDAVFFLLPPRRWGSLLVAATSVLQLGKGAGLQVRRCRPRSPSFFFPVAGPPLFSPVLLELSSLSEPCSVDNLSGATASYIVVSPPAPVAVHAVDWSASVKWLVDLYSEFLFCLAWFYMY